MVNQSFGFAYLAEQVPQRQVHGRNGLQRQALATVVECGPEHLVPHELHVSGVLPLHEAAEVPLHQLAPRPSPNGDAHPHVAPLVLHLHHQRAQRVDAPRLAGRAVLRVDLRDGQRQHYHSFFVVTSISISQREKSRPVRQYLGRVDGRGYLCKE